MLTYPLKTVLVVDDDPAARDALVLLLEAAGFAATTAADGAEALHRLRGYPKPALIILDLLLPVLDGWSFCEALRADPATACVPVIVSSGTPAPVQESGSLPVSVQEFHPKPVDPDTLLASVRRLCA